jgi:ribonuclease P protein component
MFKKENRLVPGVKFNKASFTNVPQFILKEIKNNLEVNRFGVVVSKKIDKRAVIRNKVKRSFRNALYNLNEKIVSGHDILIIVKKGVLGKTEEENRVFLEDVLKKKGILINEKNINHNN